MRLPFSRPAAPPRTTVGYTIRGRLSLYGRSMLQVQYVTDRYVITQVDRGMFIFLPDRDERFLVDRVASRLRRIEEPAQRIRVDRLRAVIGDIEITSDDEDVDDAGRQCRRFRFGSSNARMVISGETLVTRVAGLAETALHAEREHDARSQPFALPLDPDHLVVRSKLRTVAADFEQNQSYELEAIDEGIATARDYDELATLGVIE